MNNKLKKILAVTMVLVLMLSMAACGGSGDDAEVPTYIVATESTYPPFDTVDDEGNLIGIDMDLMDAIAEDQGFKIEYTDMPFDSIIPALQAGSIDIIAAGLWCDPPERREKIYFTEPYYTGGEALLVAADNTDIICKADLTINHKAASQLASAYGDTLVKMEEEGTLGAAVLLPGFDGCMLQLVNGDVDAILAPSAVMRYYMQQHEGLVKIAGPDEGEVNFAFAVQNGNDELHDMLDEGLANIRANGTYDEIMTKWLGEGHGQE